ncbi:hypothetical protein ANN_18994, partial [Periplaneta americana]
KRILSIGTWNVRTLLQAGKLQNLKEEMRRNRVDMMEISEVRWEKSGECKRSHSVGVLLRPRVKDKVISVRYVDDRMIMVEEEVEESYDKIEDIVEKERNEVDIRLKKIRRRQVTKKLNMEKVLLELNDSCEQYGMNINSNKMITMIIGRKVKKKLRASRSWIGLITPPPGRHVSWLNYHWSDGAQRSEWISTAIVQRLCTVTLSTVCNSMS